LASAPGDGVVDGATVGDCVAVVTRDVDREGDSPTT
jgi:hypothetical protein